MLFTQIIDNACRYGSNDGEQKVSIQSYERENEIVFEIKDDGIGIDSAFTEVVFNMFRRLHGQDAYGGGIGAGLTMAQKLSFIIRVIFGLSLNCMKGQVFYFHCLKP